MIMKSFTMAATAFAVALVGFGAPSAMAEVHEVQMLNKDPGNKKLKNVFIPAVLKIQPGDTVKFVSVNKGHNTQSIKGMIPEGAEKWKSKLSKDFEITFKQEGSYGYKCSPHYALGMVGLILVGDYTSNFEAIKGKKVPKKARQIFEKLFAEAAE